MLTFQEWLLKMKEDLGYRNMDPQVQPVLARIEDDAKDGRCLGAMPCINNDSPPVPKHRRRWLKKK